MGDEHLLVGAQTIVLKRIATNLRASTPSTSRRELMWPRARAMS
jgi:hypothetical protein